MGFNWCHCARKKKGVEKVNQVQKKEYTARVAQANRSQLVVIIYELFLIAIEEAEAEFHKGRLEDGVREIKRAEGFLQELMGSLDKRYDIAEPLMRLYRYIYEQLIFSVIRRKMVNGEVIKEVMGKLKAAFVEVDKEDDSEAVMENAQQLYAGLTYGKGSLNEVLISENEKNRGFRV